MARSRWLAAALLALGLVDVSNDATAQDVTAGDVVNGRRVYLAVGCMYCHGRAGQGGALNGPAPPLAKTAMPFEGFKLVLRESLRDMPAYTAAVLSDKNLADIY
jgi:mono/diheme cytochrome c family protein